MFDFTSGSGSGTLCHVAHWWKKKAQKRWEKLRSDGRIRPNLEFWNADNIDTLDIIR